MKDQTLLSQKLTPPLLNTIQNLSSSLKAVQPLSLGNSENAQLITYALIATAVVGIFVYHYIKNAEESN
jgi:hypothetical protein